jgi:hypothetical protein
MNHVFGGTSFGLRVALALLLTGPFGVANTLAEGTTERERTMSRYASCKWTDAMSKELYECVKRNNGFNTHWCFDETVQTNCEPDPLPGEAAAAPAAAAEEAAAAAPSETQEQARKRAARQGEENLRGTIEREQTMLKYKDCEWTDEMGKYTYECVKRNNGFGTHWCYDEALQLLCPKPEAEPRG